MLNTPANAITSAIRTIVNNDLRARHMGISVVNRLSTIHTQLAALEQDIPSRDPSAFETANLDAFGYATVLGFMNEHDPLALQDLNDPVRDTISFGVRASKLCLERGLKIVRVPAPDHVTQRYRKVTHVNAYPTAVLAEVMMAEVVLED